MTQGRSWKFAIGVVLAVVGAVAADAAAGEEIAPINTQLQAPDFEVPSLPFEDNTPWPIFCPPDEVPPAVNPLPVEFPNRPPTMAAPLPPALVSGGLLMAGNWLFAAARRRRT